MLARLGAALPADVRLVRVGVEAAGHYHRPLTAAGVWPAGWQVLELNPAHVTAQRRVNGQRGVKTDRVDLAAIADLLLAGRGVPVSVAGAALVELAAWVAHRARRVQVRTATKNQLLGQLDRAFPGLTPGGQRRAGHQGGPAGRRAVRRSGPAGPAGCRAVPRLRRPPRRAGQPHGGRPAGRRGPGRVAHRRGGRGPAGPGRRPGPARRPGHPDRRRRGTVSPRCCRPPSTPC